MGGHAGARRSVRGPRPFGPLALASVFGQWEGEAIGASGLGLPFRATSVSPSFPSGAPGNLRVHLRGTARSGRVGSGIPAPPSQSAWPPLSPLAPLRCAQGPPLPTPMQAGLCCGPALSRCKSMLFSAPSESGAGFRESSVPTGDSPVFRRK